MFVAVIAVVPKGNSHILMHQLLLLALHLLDKVGPYILDGEVALQTR